MTREEIKYASKDYVNYLLDKQEYHNENYTEDDIRQAFEKGAMLANNNPNTSSPWHDASEMPNNHSYIMFMIDRYTIKTGYVPACLKHCQLNGSNWNEFVKATNMKRWAYISDLLPKGGEE